MLEVGSNVEYKEGFSDGFDYAKQRILTTVRAMREEGETDLRSLIAYISWISPEGTDEE